MALAEIIGVVLFAAFSVCWAVLGWIRWFMVDYLTALYLKWTRRSKPASQQLPTSTSIQLSRGRCQYLLAGKPSDPLIVFVGGELLSGRSLYHSIANPLKFHGFQILVYDPFGTGHSESPPCQCDDRFCLEQLVELTQSLGLSNKPFTLCGFSSGALISISFAAHYPEMVSRLILIAPGGFPGAIYQQPLISLVTWLLKQPQMERPLRDFVNFISNVVDRLALLRNSSDFSSIALDHLLRPTRSTELVWDEYAEAVDRDPKAFQQYALSTLLYFPLFGPIDELILERLRNHPQKILLIWGTEDGVFNCRKQSRHYLENLPQVQFAAIENASHYVYIDKNHECVDAILQFMRNTLKVK